MWKLIDAHTNRGLGFKSGFGYKFYCIRIKKRYEMALKSVRSCWVWNRSYFSDTLPCKYNVIFWAEKPSFWPRAFQFYSLESVLNISLSSTEQWLCAVTKVELDCVLNEDTINKSRRKKNKYKSPLRYFYFHH